RVEDDLHGPPVRQERHVLLRDDPRHDPLVPVAARHLVADADLPLLGDVHLHELHNAGRELVGLEDLVDLLFRLLPNAIDAALGLIDHAADLLARRAILDLERGKVDLAEVQSLDLALGQLGPLFEIRLHRATLQHEGDGLALEQLLELLVPGLGDATDLLALVRAELADPFAALLLEERVVVAPAEDLDVDDRPFHPRRDLEGRVLHVLGLLTEDRGEELLLRRQLRLALRRDLADQDVPGLHPGADAHDAALVQLDQAVLRDVRDLARDLLHPALGVPDLELQLLDVDRREDVVLDQLLADDDRVLEI